MKTKNFLSFTIALLYSVSMLQGMVGSPTGTTGTDNTSEASGGLGRSRTVSSLTAARAGAPGEVEAGTETGVDTGEETKGADSGSLKPSSTTTLTDTKSAELFERVCRDEKTCMEVLEKLTTAELQALTTRYGMKGICSLVASALFKDCLNASIATKTFMKNEMEQNRQHLIWNFSHLGFSIARTAVETNDPTLLAILRGTGLDVNIIAPDNKITPLMQAAQNGLFSVMEAMLREDVGAQINFMNFDEKTALDFVPKAAENYGTIVVLREKYGAKTGDEVIAARIASRSAKLSSLWI